MSRRSNKRGKRRSASKTRNVPQAHHQSHENKPVGQGWVRLDLSATLIEDAHLGSGSGGGGIDALVARDRDGRPVIWASHLKGLLRDAARRIRGADVAGDLFGRGGRNRQQVLLTSLYATSDPASRVWRSTARASFDNRAPRNETLRAIEHVPKGTLFNGAVEVRCEDRDLLQRLMQEVDAVGRGRATGAGRVRLQLSEAQIAQRTLGKATERLHLLLRCRDPLCITATATPDNMVPSQAFIPGRTMLGAIAGWLISEGARDVASLLTGARVSVTDALPLPDDPQQLENAEVLPAPLTLQREKPTGADGVGPWWAQQPSPPVRLDRWQEDAGAKLKRPEADLFVYRASQDVPWQAYRPLMRVRLRNGRPAAHQAEPSLFAVEQIAERTAFLCEIRGNQMNMKKLAKALAPVLTGQRWLRVGRGGAPVEVEQLAWSKAPQATAQQPSEAYLILTSDLLVRDVYLRWMTSLDAERFHGFPGWPGDVRVVRTLQDAAPVHGFNGTSRLWRLPSVAVRRGSVYEVQGNGVAKLWEMAAEGRRLGERTHEGFGQFRLCAIDALPGTGPTVSSAGRPTNSPADEATEAVARTTKAWFHEHCKLAKVAKKDAKGQRPPSLSQWMDLIAALERRDHDALSSRKPPTTAGARSWANSGAIKILECLEEIDGVRRGEHARMFVRWLRSEMRKNSRRETV